MNTLILPVGGKSSRYNGMRPKWLMTMPDGKLMVEKCIEKISLKQFDNVILVCLKEHVDSYISQEKLDTLLDGYGPKFRVRIIDTPTRSQAETVAVCLQKEKIEKSFFVKDCDNLFSFTWSGGNEIAVLDLNSVGLIDAKNKSYVTIDSLGNVLNIIEKKVVSNLFCCGGYGFSSAETFLSHFNKIDSDQEIYLSHVIYSMLVCGEQFAVGYAGDYIDWGTAREFLHYSKSHATVFCDVDGVLLNNGSKFGKVGWQTDPITENLKTIAQLQSRGGIYLVVTSSRPESEIPHIRQKLLDHHVHVDRWVMGLPHSQRVLINDYASTNPYPSATAINIERDAPVLSKMLNRVVGW